MTDSKPSLSKILETVGNNEATRSVSGMVGVHEATDGRIHLLYSEEQRVAHVEKILKPTFPKRENSYPKLGAALVLDIENGQHYWFTDISVLQGEESSINYNIRPFHMRKSFNPTLCPPAADTSDLEMLAVVNPKNLVEIISPYGGIVHQTFEDPNPKNGSLVLCYGRERALEIVDMIKKLPDDIRPPGIYNGVNDFDSFETVIEKGRIEGALSGRFSGSHYPSCRPSNP